MQEFIRIISEFDGINPKWINIIGFVFIGLVGLINIGIGWYGNSKIEKYKHELSIISTRTGINYKEHFDSQTVAIKQLYVKYVNLKYATDKLIDEVLSSSPYDEFTNRIMNWRRQMSDVHMFYNRNLIIFSEKIRKEFGNQLEDFEKINTHLKSEYLELISQDNSETDDKVELQNEINDTIINKIKIIKNKNEFTNISQSFNTCKKLLELEYKQLTKL